MSDAGRAPGSLATPGITPPSAVSSIASTGSSSCATGSARTSTDVNGRRAGIATTKTTHSDSPTAKSCSVPLYWLIAHPDCDLLELDEDCASFWTIFNAADWANAPSIVKLDEKKAHKAERMADPFEVRMRFSGQLQHLNASVVSAQKAAQYALKYKDMSEDLHSCILEQLEKNSMNTRANIMYFIEPFLELADKDRCTDYIRRMQRDIIRVVDAVCPEDGSGAANVKVVRKVLQGLNSKGFLLNETVAEIEECLKDRAAAAHAELGLSSPPNGEDAVSKSRTAAPTSAATGSGDLSNGPKSARNGAPRLEKRQIEQRIEEDRERHKKRRENMWVVPKTHEERKAKIYDDMSDVGEDAGRQANEEGEDYEYWFDTRP